jgi:hypothetical protein
MIRDIANGAMNAQQCWQLSHDGCEYTMFIISLWRD